MNKTHPMIFVLLFLIATIAFSILLEVKQIRLILQRAERYSVSTATSGWQRVAPTGLGAR